MRKPILAFVALLGGLFIAVSWISAAIIPAGTTLVVRTIDGISSNDKAGKRFAGKLDSSLVVSGNVVVPAGSKVYGRVNNSQSASLNCRSVSPRFRSTASSSLLLQKIRCIREHPVAERPCGAPAPAL